MKTKTLKLALGRRCGKCGHVWDSGVVKTNACPECYFPLSIVQEKDNLGPFRKIHGNAIITEFISGKRMRQSEWNRKGKKHIKGVVAALSKIVKAERINVGDRVEILSLCSGIGKRKGKTMGKVTKIDGGYFYVRPAWCKFKIELYENEIRKA